MMQVWGVTDIGLVRKENQDAYLIRESTASGHTICVVCDGMGGAAGGQVASRIATETFTSELEKVLTPEMTPEQLIAASSYAAALANQAIQAAAAEREEYKGMGTTLVAAVTYESGVAVINVGDSRAYSVKQDGVQQITRDHSLVQMMVARGELTPEQARTYPGKNLITRAIGTEPVVECDVFHRRLDGGECLLLCTDGLSNLVDEQEILFEVVHGINKQSSGQRLLEIAKNRGAPDNVTCVLIQI